MILFGGFNEGPLDKVYHFKLTQGSVEGEIEESKTARLAEKDFFVVNGILIKYQGEQNGHRREVIVTGHNHVHAFDL